MRDDQLPYGLRLAKLQQLLDDGLISSDEYEQRRQDIIDEAVDDRNPKSLGGQARAPSDGTAHGNG